MNKDNILNLAKVIVRAEYFDMSDTVNCGAPACIAGWAAWLQLGQPEELVDNAEPWMHGTNNIVNAALDYLGVEENRGKIADELFCGNHNPYTLRNITAKEAAKTLRHFAKTGEVNWFGAVEAED